ncbi:EAL domain-containing protein [Actinoplanes solisilvae]|uniref:EAL domain-containing protein n=1 Tax=Actinoplanes solisilvae TaxID=2486853 RepID=UPI00196B5327|nr:EAL domain-containing protein [Actinoplanes solisilvae]
MPVTTETRVDWPEMLRAAVNGDGVRSVYQPIVDLARGTVVGYEALVRFDGYPVTNPEAWFTAARVHGYNAELQAAAMRTALVDRPSLPANCFLTVNVGPEVLRDPAIQQILADEGDLSGLIIELTEHVAVESYAALQPDLNRLKAAGALIAMDDAGSGYAGLSQILAVRPSLIKLDRELVQDLDQDEAKRALVEMVGMFAGRIDAWLLAEGVERQGELDALSSLAVPLAQGYHLGRPELPWTDASVRVAPRAGDQSALRQLLEHPPVHTDPGSVGAALSDPAADLVVLCDHDRRPIACFGTGLTSSNMRVNVDTPVRDAALRAITRTGAEWSHPLLCIDNAGRYVGVVRVQRLLHALSTDGFPQK